MPFVHLINHSDFSMLRSSIRTDDIVANAKRDADEQTVFEDHANMRREKDPENKGKFLEKGSVPFSGAAALTDRGNMCGALELYFPAIQAGIKPILGCELIYAPKGRRDLSDPDIVWLLAENNEGYYNLIDLVSQGYLNDYKDEPVVDWKRMTEKNKGLFAIYGGRRSHLGRALLDGNAKLAKERVDALRELFDHDHFFLTIQNNGAPDDKTLIAKTEELADAEGIQVVATGDNHYARREDRKAWQVLRCIARREKLADYKDEWPGELHCRTADEMELLFRDRPEAIANTVKIADACNVVIRTKTGYEFWPVFPIPEGFADADEYLAHITWERAPKRYPDMTEEQRTRIQNELDMMKKMHVAGYMLIVQDFIVWSKEHGVPVGPGRGSAAGSVVAYIIGITNIDPFSSGLLFDRFLHPERVSMPDIDTDFSDLERGRVVDYVAERYGQDCVGQIITYGRLKAKAVLIDVASVLGMNRNEFNAVTKKIPALINGLQAPPKKKEGKSSVDEMPEMREHFVNGTEQYRQIWAIALKLENLVRQAGVHAAAVIIAPKPLRELAPLYRAAGEKTPAIQYDKHYAEDIGFLKMDFLGLRNLSVITDALEMIEENHGVKLDMDHVDLTDPEAFKLMQEGRTIGVFQFESPGMQKYLRTLRPTSIFELIAMNALYRPGPIESIPRFIKRKNGEEPIDCYDPKFEGILGETYGVIVYQEQVMKLSQELSGFSLGEADNLRRAMAKKKGMETFEGKFKDGAVARGFPRALAEKLWDVLIPFSNYAFNKSHSAAYGFVAFQTAFLKAHYPAEFMAANITSEIANADRVAVLIQECRDLGIKVIPPDVNRNKAQFSVLDGCLNYGLAGIRGIGMPAARAIVAERAKGGPFRSLFDFARRMAGENLINKKALECLTMAGAFDGLEGTRASQFASVDKAIDHGAKCLREKESAQVNLFGDFGGEGPAPEDPQLENAAPWSSLELLDKEKKVLGLFVSSHPLEDYELELRSFSTAELLRDFPFSDLPEGLPWRQRNDPSLKRRVFVGGMVEKFQARVSEKGQNAGKPFGSGVLATKAGEHLDFVFWPDVFAAVQDRVAPESIVLLSGYLEHRRGGGPDDVQLVGENAWSLESVLPKLTRAVHVDVDLSAQGAEFLDELNEFLDDCAPEPGEPAAKIVINAALPSKKRVHALLDQKHAVAVTRGFVKSLAALAGGTSRIRLAREV